MERYIDKETGEVFEENANDVLRKETLKYIRSDDNEKYSYKQHLIQKRDSLCSIESEETTYAEYNRRTYEHHVIGAVD